MKWISYKIEQSVVNGQPVLLDKKVGYNEVNLTIAQAEAYNGEYIIEEDDEDFEVKPISVAFGGTGATSAEDARKKLGIPVRNLLDNSDFTNPVNQRGETEYDGSNSYTIDRWLSNMLVNIFDGYINLANISDSRQKSFYQHLPEGTFDEDKTYTLAFKTLDGTVYCGSVKPVFGETVYFFNNNDERLNADFYTYGIDGELGGGTISINIDYAYGLDIVWIALYEGDYTIENLPPYISKGYFAELTECKYYYQIIGHKNRNTVLGVGMGYNASSIYVGLPGINMRDSYTVNMVTDISTLQYTESNLASAKGATSISSYNAHRGNAVSFSIGGSFTAGKTYTLWLNSGIIEISADL